MQKRDKTVSYRRAEIRNREGNLIEKTLQDLMYEALAVDFVPDPVKLDYGVEGPGTSMLLYTRKNREPYNRMGCLCGSISLYDDESKVPLIDSVYDDGSDELYTECVPPVDSQNKRRKLEQQTHYFAINGNHVAVVTSSSQGMSHLRDFFVMLLQDISKVVECADVQFVNIPAQEAISKLSDSPVRSISFNSSAYNMKTIPLSQEERAERMRRGGKGSRQYIRSVYEQTDMLKAILGVLKGERFIEDICESDDMSGLCVAIEFSYKKKKEKGQQFLNDLARHVGGIEGVSPVLKLSNNCKITSDELTVKGVISVLCEGKNLVRLNVFQELAAWLVSQIRSGCV